MALRNTNVSRIHQKLKGGKCEQLQIPSDYIDQNVLPHETLAAQNTINNEDNSGTLVAKYAKLLSPKFLIISII